MFNEKSSGWIKLLKGFIEFIFFATIIIGVIGGYGDASAEFCDIDLGGNDAFLDFIAWTFSAVLLAFLNLSCGMILINFLNNVQIIREKLENSQK